MHYYAHNNYYYGHNKVYNIDLLCLTVFITFLLQLTHWDRKYKICKLTKTQSCSV